MKVNKSLYWDGNSNSDRYNQLVNDELYQNFDKRESEHLIDVYPGFEYAMNINYNKEEKSSKALQYLYIVLLIINITYFTSIDYPT